MKIKTKRMILILAGLCWFTSINAQQSDSLNFFPSHIGDFWRYQKVFSNTSWTLTLTRDSLDIDGNRYLFYNNESMPLRVIDSLNNVYSGYTNDLMYVLGADTDTTWFAFGHLWAWVDTIEVRQVFTKMTTVKTINFSPLHPDSGGSDFISFSDQLAAGFGKIRTDFTEDPQYTTLTGCIIESDTFGIITSIEQQPGFLPVKISLSQNFPNPFNSTTQFIIDLPKMVNIELNLFNILGQKVRRIDKALRGPGRYTYLLDLNAQTGGIYLLQLTADRQFIQRKIIYTK